MDVFYSANVKQPAMSTGYINETAGVVLRNFVSFHVLCGFYRQNLPVSVCLFFYVFRIFLCINICGWR